jgi:hypothetical protein
MGKNKKAKSKKNFAIYIPSKSLMKMYLKKLGLRCTGWDVKIVNALLNDIICFDTFPSFCLQKKLK